MEEKIKKFKAEAELLDLHVRIDGTRLVEVTGRVGGYFEVPGFITETGPGCFAFLKGLKSLRFLEGCEKLETGTFSGCPGLEKVALAGNRLRTLPESMAETGSSAIRRAMMNGGVEVSITYRANKSTTLLPASAVRNEGEGSDYVYLIQRDWGGVLSSSSMKVVKTRDVDAIAKAVKEVNESKTAKEKADAEAKAKAEQEAAAAAAAQQQAQASQSQSAPQRQTPSYSQGSSGSGSGSGRRPSSGGSSSSTNTGGASPGWSVPTPSDGGTGLPGSDPGL